MGNRDMVIKIILLDLEIGLRVIRIGLREGVIR